MKKKLSTILKVVLTLVIILNITNMNSFAIKKTAKEKVRKSVTNSSKNIISKKNVKKVLPTKKKNVVETKKQAISAEVAIDGGTKWLNTKIATGDYKINDWYVVALSLAGKDINADSYKKDGKGYIDFKKENISSIATTSSAITIYSKNIMGLMAAGYDPSYFEGHDLLQEISRRVEKGDDTVIGEAWGMIALSAAGADFNKIDAIRNIETKQNKDGGYGWIAGATSDVDTTAMVTYALNMCGRDKNTTSIKKSLGFIKKSLKDMEKVKSKENVESLDQVLMAVIACGEKLDSYKLNGNNLVNEIIGFRASDGGFKHVVNGTSNEISTYQTIIALEFYKNNKNMYSKLKDNEKNSLAPISGNIRIEGPDKTIITKTITLNNRIVFDNNGIAFDTKKISAYAFLANALNGNGIPSHADYSYGAPYISTINNVKGGTFGGWDGWMFLVNGVAPESGMTDVEIKNGDKIVVFYGDFGILPITLDINKDVKVSQSLVIKAIAGGKPLKGVSININGINSGLTDDNGIVNYKIDKAGVYNIFGENNDKLGKPLNIRSEVTQVTIK